MKDAPPLMRGMRLWHSDRNLNAPFVTELSVVSDRTNMLSMAECLNTFIQLPGVFVDAPLRITAHQSH
ncbi:hypothetical protein [Chromatium okenii]|uniref:hypothetical protein n=1 Tax=Chromatium okenii TaxID=61644 RepID=UPI0026EABC50|nr:hypothetical protein [Chromatium okenii]MBV5307962.1 hypothetical protein [Chromatium okenii]